MTGALLIGVDAGTSVIKAVAFDLDGRPVGSAARKNAYTQLGNGGVEQDMGATWEKTAAVLKELGERIEGLAERVVALAVTGQGDGTWMIDGAGTPVHDGWLWLDGRAGAEARAMAAAPGMATAYRETGTGVNISQMRTHLTWMKTHAPDLIERAATAFHCKDWLYFRLTGERATDPTEALMTWGDFRARTYSEAVFEALDLAECRRLMPPIVDGAAETHPLSEEAAAATGLPAGLPVSLAYLDVICTGLGAGLVDESVTPGLTILGSTGIHMRYCRDAEAVTLNDAQAGYTLALPGRAFAQMQTNMVATINIDWILGVGAELLAAHGVEATPADLLDGLDARVSAARPGAALYHPYASTAGERGPFAEPNARASFTGLDQNAGWFDLVRSVYDGLVLAARDCYRAMGPLPSEIRISGGAARSSALTGMLANALGRPVRGVEQEEAGAAGAVMMAAIANGHFKDADAASRAWVDPLMKEAVTPEPEAVALYDALFDGYLATREALEPAWHVQARMREALA